MNEDRQMFVDPETDERIESTWLAREASGLIRGMVVGPFVGVAIVVIFVLVCVVIFGLHRVLANPSVSILLGMMLCGAVATGLTISLLTYNVKAARSNRFSRWAHDLISRVQHRRRQRVLRSQERHDIPNTAISRAQPPGEPVPTDTALSLADEPDEPSHLPVSIEEDTQAVVDDTT